MPEYRVVRVVCDCYNADKYVQKTINEWVKVGWRVGTLTPLNDCGKTKALLITFVSG